MNNMSQPSIPGTAVGIHLSRTGMAALLVVTNNSKVVDSNQPKCAGTAAAALKEPLRAAAVPDQEWQSHGEGGLPLLSCHMGLQNRWNAYLYDTPSRVRSQPMSSKAHRLLDLHSVHHDDDDDGLGPPGYVRHPLLRQLTPGRPWA